MSESNSTTEISPVSAEKSPIPVDPKEDDDDEEDESMIGQPLHLQFCPWLMQQISSGKFRDLEWLDKDRKRLFKIPWTKKYLPNWQEHNQIFKAWAEYRGLYDASTAPLCRMKSNFRTILRKCAVIEEVPNAHQLGLQTGNYKVYRVLTQKEAIQKRNERRKLKEALPKPKRKRAIAEEKLSEPLSKMEKPSPGPAPIVNTINPVVSPYGCTFPMVISSLRHCPVSWPTTANTTEQAKVEIIIDGQVGSHGLLTMPKANFIKSNDNQLPQDNTDSPKEQMKSEQKTDENGSTHGFQMLLQAAKIAEESNDSKSSVVVEEKSTVSIESGTKVFLSMAPKAVPPSVVDVLQELNISCEELFTYEVVVKYESKTVLQSSFPDMKQGYRVFYCNETEKKTNKFQDLKYEKLDYQPVKLPNASVLPGNSLYTVLKNMSPGLFLSSDQAHTLKGKRLCLSRIFVFTSYGDVKADSGPATMANNQDTVLFSYKKFLDDWRQFLVKGSPQPNVGVNFAFGRKPKNRNSRVFVSIILTPKAAKTMMEKVTSIQASETGPSALHEGKFNNVLRMFYS